MATSRKPEKGTLFRRGGLRFAANPLFVERVAPSLLILLEFRLVQPILGDLGSDAAPRQAANARAATDVAARPLQGSANVVLFYLGHRLPQMVGQRLVEVDG